MVAFVGGLILIALGLAIRALNRIELALAARPMPRAARPGEAAAPSIPVVASLPTASLPPPSLAQASVAAEEQAPPAARIPFPPKAKAAVPTPAPAHAATAILPAPAEEAGFDLLREKFPNLARIDAAPAVAEGTDVSLLPAPAHAEEHVAEASNGVAVHHMNGAAKSAPRAEVAARPAAKPQKTSVFDTFWPKAQRAREAAAAVPAPVAVSPEPEELPPPSAPRIEIAPAPQPPQSAPVQREVPRPVSVLKSGVVDGMAYTLYSDGSIEAQLPQGTLRFGSINELRNHIEQTS
jgi:hypothetical protein